VGRFEAPRLLSDGAGEGAFDMANSSLSSRLSVRAPQLTRLRPVAARLRRWMLRAINSLPVPVSPTSKTLAARRGHQTRALIDGAHGQAGAHHARSGASQWFRCFRDNPSRVVSREIAALIMSWPRGAFIVAYGSLYAK